MRRWIEAAFQPLNGVWHGSNQSQSIFSPTRPGKKERRRRRTQRERERSSTNTSSDDGQQQTKDQCQTCHTYTTTIKHNSFLNYKLIPPPAILSFTGSRTTKRCRLFKRKCQINISSLTHLRRHSIDGCGWWWRAELFRDREKKKCSIRLKEANHSLD